MSILKTVLFAALVSLPALASAHSFWLEPERFVLEQPGEIAVAFRAGDGTDIEPWNLRWDNVVSLRSYNDSGIADHQTGITVRSDGVDGGANVDLAVAGTHILAFESQPSFSNLEAARFNPYAEEEGLTAVLAVRERSGTTTANGTELYSRRAKTLIQVGDEATANALRPIGHTLEIVPERHPYAMGEDRRLPVRILFRGRPLEGALVELTDLGAPAEPVARQLTDKEGRTVFEVPERGAWRVNLIWSVPTIDDRAEFETLFASLTFGYPGE